MTISNIRVASPAELDTVVNTITLAFSGDPLNRWWLSSGDDYLKFFPEMVAALAEPALETGTCFLTDGAEGAAIWYPPGVHANEEKMQAIVSEFLKDNIAEEVGGVFEFLESSHPKDEDCWYLPLVGVDPGHQGKGFGAVLMKHATSLLDAQGALGYLESSNPMNISLYQRHGFQIVEQRQFAESVIISPMIRVRS